MGKAKRERVLKDNEAQAVLRMVRISPRKLNLVAQLIRGKKVSAALADLEFSQQADRRRRCKKTLQSAIANAENNHELDVDNLVVAEAHVGKALVMKRFNPRARGRVGRILKPFSQPDRRGPRSRRKRLRTRAWDRKSIRSGFASGSTRPGIRAGSPTTREYGNAAA